MRLLALLALLCSCQEAYCLLDGGEIKRVRVWEVRNPLTGGLTGVRVRRMCAYKSDRWFEAWYLRD